jgi:hypothetical protein
MQSVEDSVAQLTDSMFTFTQKTCRQRINQRNRVEWLSPLLDWKNLGVEYSKARQLALNYARARRRHATGQADEGSLANLASHRRGACKSCIRRSFRAASVRR